MRPQVTTQRVGVEVLTVTDCPHRGLTLARLRAALDRVGLADVVVTERVIDDPAEAIAAGMHGSPTILVDGHDPFAESGTEPSVSCRLFRTPNGDDGAPSVEALVVALTDLGRALSDCREPVPLGVSEAAARRLRVEGFVALWRGERVTVTDLCDDPMVIDAQVRSGRLEVDDAGVLVGVHGLTARPTRHRIECGDAAVHTWCALDAIGIPAALAIDATAVTSCPRCGIELEVVLRGGKPVDTPAAWRLWLPEGRCDHLVEDFCNNPNLYCSNDHLTATATKASGRALTVADVIAIGRATWADAADALADTDATLTACPQP
jgi:Alkylmercury lyase